MERISIFEIFKIGVGPSSSHTMGPWKAANQFAEKVKNKKVDAVRIFLYGSLSKTGIGHATDFAVMLGLEGYEVENIDTDKISTCIFKIKSENKLNFNGYEIDFNPNTDMIFENYALPFHPNGLTFVATHNNKIILEETYYSIGGGFIIQEGVTEDTKNKIVLDHPIDKGIEILNYTEKTGLSISEIVQKNELCFRSEAAIAKGISDIFVTMKACIYAGCTTSGILPGGLNVKRRAKPMSEMLLQGARFSDMDSWFEAVKASGKSFDNINKWISCFALAVNEQNASLGRVVTSPTNGAAGVIPAVLFYYYCFCDFKGDEDIRKFLFVSGEIGCLFKKGATISAAVGGCQAEIGVSSAMAAGGLTELLGGTPKQVLMAAEIAMEHHLGLTCDPIGGLVQIPCIERNTMGAIKAITASNLALTGNPDDAIVNFDTVVKTMWDTAQAMSHKYKETSEGGLAMNIPVNLADC